MNISVLTILTLLGVYFAHDIDVLYDDLAQREFKEQLAHFSSDCVYRNVKISSHNHQQIMILRQRREQIVDEFEEAFFKLLRQQQLGSQTIIDLSPTNGTIPIFSRRSLHVIWFVDKYTDYIDIGRLYEIFERATAIHIVYLRKATLSVSEFDRTAKMYFKIFREQIIDRIRFHGRRSITANRNVWRTLKAGRSQRMTRAAECVFDHRSARVVEIQSPRDGYPRVMRILARHIPPFALFEEDRLVYGGIEVQLMELVAQRLTMKTIYEIEPDKSAAAYKASINNLFFSEIDVIIGGYANVSLTPSLMVSTRPYLPDDATWCVANARFLRPWANLFIIFDDSRVVALNLCAALMGSIVLFGFTRKHHIDRNMSYMQTCIVLVRLFLNASVRYKVKNTLGRILATIMLLCAVLYYHAMTSCYIGMIAFRIQEKQTMTQRQLIESNYKLAGDVSSYQWLMSKRAFLSQQLNAFRVCENHLECLLPLLHDRHLAVGGSRLYSLNQVNIPGSQIYCFSVPETIHSYSVKSLVRNDFPGLAAMDKIIQYSFEGGLFIKWTRDSQRINPYEMNIFAGGLTLEHLAAGFCFYIIGNLGALFFYGCEHLIYSKKKQLKRPRWFWTYIDRIMDDRRYFFVRSNHINQIR